MQPKHCLTIEQIAFYVKEFTNSFLREDTGNGRACALLFVVVANSLKPVLFLLYRFLSGQRRLSSFMPYGFSDWNTLNRIYIYIYI